VGGKREGIESKCGEPWPKPIRVRRCGEARFELGGGGKNVIDEKRAQKALDLKKQKDRRNKKGGNQDVNLKPGEGRRSSEKKVASLAMRKKKKGKKGE